MLLLELLITVKIDTGTREGKKNLANASQCHNVIIHTIIGSYLPTLVILIKNNNKQVLSHKP